MSKLPLLSILTFLPLVGVILLAFLPKEKAKYMALSTAILNFLFSLLLLPGFQKGNPNLQFVEKWDWIPALGASYHIGVDGISLFLILLTTMLSAIAIYASFDSISTKVKSYYASLLLLEVGMIGVFLAVDMLLFYLFWEVMLIPMYFLIGIWGHERRIYAAIKFLLYTMAGSALMLVGILFIYYLNYKTTGVFSFNLMDWEHLILSPKQQYWLFLAFFIAFAIKVPLFPLHTWLPDAHVEAPTAGSVILAGVLLKMGTYGFLRFCLPLFPSAVLVWLPVVCLLALIGIVYGGLVAMVQPDMKKLVAYSSVSHLGYVVLGIFVLNIQGITGGLLQMINHGLSTGALFLMVGMLYNRRHTRLIEEFGGIAKVIPAFFFVFLIVTFSSIGLPGLNGFVGEFSILVGAFKFNPIYGAVASFGIIIGAVYMLWMLQRVMFGEVTKDVNNSLKDLNYKEILALIPILVLMFWIGIYPKPFIERMEPSIQKVIKRYEPSPVVTPAVTTIQTPALTTGTSTTETALP